MSKITGKVNYKEVLKGDNGYTFEPHVTTDGVLYWSNNGNLPNPLPVNIKGKNGDMAQEVKMSNINESINKLNNQSNYYKITNCVGDGITDDSNNIENEINQAIKNGYTKIILPNSKKIRLTRTLHFINGIEVNGNNSTIIRDFGKENYSLINLHGNNKFYNFNIDGGNRNDVIEGEDFINYCDVYVNGENIEIYNSNLDYSKGSNISIQESFNIMIKNCVFKNFLDHAIYSSSPNNQKINKSIKIYNNVIINNETQRDAIKLRNGVENIIIKNNDFNLENGYFLTINTGDHSNIIKQCNNVICNSNIGTTKRFISFNSDNEKININNIEVSSNIVNVYDYFFGNLPMYDYSVNDLNINNNTINKIGGIKSFLFQLNANNKHGCGNIYIKNNVINFGTIEKTIGAFTGKFKTVYIINNTFNSVYNEFIDKYSNNLFTFGEKYYKNGIKATFDKIIFNNNNVNGNISPLFGDVANNENCYFDGNISIMNNLMDVNNNVRLLHTNGLNYQEINKYLININNIEINNKNIDVKYNNNFILK